MIIKQCQCGGVFIFMYDALHDLEILSKCIHLQQLFQKYENEY